MVLFVPIVEEELLIKHWFGWSFFSLVKVRRIACVNGSLVVVKLGDGSGVKGYFTDDDCNTVTAIVRSIWWAVTTQPSTNKLQLRPLKRKQDRW